MSKTYIGIDNGVTGTIAIINEAGNLVFFDKIPVKVEQSYTKAKQNISRIVAPELQFILEENVSNPLNCYCLIERPMINPTRWKASMSGIRALEATLTVLELLGIPYGYIDSREWQKALLPSGLEKEELKKASLDIGTRLFPNVKLKHPDRDGLLICEHARRKNL